jgi:hypothetical protein
MIPGWHVVVDAGVFLRQVRDMSWVAASRPKALAMA